LKSANLVGRSRGGAGSEYFKGGGRSAVRCELAIVKAYGRGGREVLELGGVTVLDSESVLGLECPEISTDGLYGAAAASIVRS
jgi:hypothetical protein